MSSFYRSHFCGWFVRASHSSLIQATDYSPSPEPSSRYTGPRCWVTPSMMFHRLSSGREKGVDVEVSIAEWGSAPSHHLFAPSSCPVSFQRHLYDWAGRVRMRCRGQSGQLHSHQVQQNEAIRENERRRGLSLYQQQVVKKHQSAS